MEIEDYEEELRRTNRAKKTYLIGMILIAVIAIGLVANDQFQYNSLTTLHNSLQSQYNTLEGQFKFLQSSYNYNQGQLSELQQEMNNVLKYYDQQRVVYQTPGVNTTIPIWTRDAVVQPGTWTDWALLDTFVNHIQISSNATVEYIILDLPNYVNLARNAVYTPVVDNSTTSFSYTARISQGCAVYVLVIYNHSSHPILLSPNVTATYAPTPFLTGQCSLP